MVKKYFLIRIGRTTNKNEYISLTSSCWIPLPTKYNTPEEAETNRNGYNDPENFLIMSCYETK